MALPVRRPVVVNSRMLRLSRPPRNARPPLTRYSRRWTGATTCLMAHTPARLAPACRPRLKPAAGGQRLRKGHSVERLRANHTGAAPGAVGQKFPRHNGIECGLPDDALAAVFSHRPSVVDHLIEIVSGPNRSLSCWDHSRWPRATSVRINATVRRRCGARSRAGVAIPFLAPSGRVTGRFRCTWEA
jgi:hypothetical protein